ncbi:MAG: cysteine desulfurase [Firmicutes bacterium]|nr:cysteine desulfurase [Bacillota bacterium]
MIYLDNSATTKPSKACLDAMTDALTKDFGNPSSLYRIGLDAEKIVKHSREVIAKSIGADPSEVYFTSCGSESDDTAIFGAWSARKKQGKRMITTAVEHPAVLRCFEKLQQEGADVQYIPVLSDGNLDMDAFRKLLNDDTVFVSVMHVNNETGAIFPIEEIAKELKKYPNVIFHSDCVQSYGKLDIDVKKMGVDMISLSGHKVHASKGIGALYVRNGLHIPPYILGGGQEAGFRSGTENVPGIAGFGAAVEDMHMVKPEAREYLKKRLLEEIEDIQINSPETAAPSVLNVSFLGCRGEVLLHMLEQDEIYVSTGSACSSHKKGSHVLSAQGLSPEAIDGAVRFSFGSDNTVEEMDIVVEKLKKYVAMQRRLRKAVKRS